MQETEVRVAWHISADFKAAMEDNFPPEQRPVWNNLERTLEEGYSVIHELRHRQTDQLLSARLMSTYTSRFRGDPSFALICFAVSPEPKDEKSMGGKNKGYGSYLLKKSQELLELSLPNAIGIIAECEAVSNDNDTRRIRRVAWLKKAGRRRILGFDYEIPPEPPTHFPQPKTMVSERHGVPGPAYLLITRFDGQDYLEGRTLYSIVEHLYTGGYGIPKEDPYLNSRLSLIDREKNYSLEN